MTFKNEIQNVRYVKSHASKQDSNDTSFVNGRLKLLNQSTEIHSANIKLTWQVFFNKKDVNIDFSCPALSPMGMSIEILFLSMYIK